MPTEAIKYHLSGYTLVVNHIFISMSIHDQIVLILLYGHSELSGNHDLLTAAAPSSLDTMSSSSLLIPYILVIIMMDLEKT